jgi:hypothetical protein
MKAPEFQRQDEELPVGPSRFVPDTVLRMLSLIEANAHSDRQSGSISRADKNKIGN